MKHALALIAAVRFGALFANNGCASAQSPEDAPHSNLVFHVAPDGADGNDGTLQMPFATLERARDAIRERKRQLGGLPSGGAEVVLRGGTYRRETAFVLGEEDSGARSAPIVFRASPGEKASLIGGVEAPLADFAPVADPAILARLPEEARGKVWSLNLRERGIDEYGEIPLYGASVLAPYTAGPTAPELFVNGKAMTLARWPNSDYALVESVVEPGSILRMWMPDMEGRDDRRGVYVPPERRENPPKGFAFTIASDRPLRWTAAEDAWLYGYWYYDWSDQSARIRSIDPQTGVIRTEHASGYGVRENQRFFAFNLLEELDAPGEWHLDRKAGILYLYPPEGDRQGTAALSLCTEPLVRMSNASHIVLRDLTLSTTRGSALEIEGGEGVTIEQCDIGNLGGKAIAIDNGQRHTIRGCIVHDTGADAISATGGDRATLASGGHAIVDNEIMRFSRLRKTYAPAITLAGVGNRAAHNLIYDAPHAAIHFLGNDHIIEFNEIHHVLLESDDAGAVYSGRRLTFWGNKIRYNFFHDILGLPPEKVRFKKGVLAHAVYLDDDLSGIEISGNVFLRCNNTVGIKGGDNRIENNLALDCRRGVWDMSKAPPGAYPEPLRFDQPDRLPKNLDLTVLEDILSVPYASAVWRERYPGLADSLERTYGPWRVSVCRNILCRTPPIETNDWMRSHGRIEDNLLLADAEAPADDSALEAWIATLPGRLPGFMAIPFDKIGPRGPTGPRSGAGSAGGEPKAGARK